MSHPSTQPDIEVMFEPTSLRFDGGAALSGSASEENALETR
ncbi:hypothetical protein [Rhizobium sp. P40RR-XXII]|nr:hypothetical protein [Rhizobium sp. P40RR-XXII]